MKVLLKKLDKYLLYTAVFLVPLFFLSFSQNVLAYAKHFLLLTIVFLCLIAFLIKQVINKKFVFRAIDNKFYWTIGLILVFFILSTVFSVWPNASFWGLPTTVSDSLIIIFIFILLTFLSANVFDDKKELLVLVKVLLCSAGLSALFSILQLLGIHIFPFDFARTTSFALVGSVFASAIFSAVLLPLSLIFIKSWRNILTIIPVVLFLNIFLVNSKDAWIVLLFSSFLSLLFSTRSPDKKIKWTWSVLLMLLLVFSLVFVFFRIPLVNFANQPVEVSLSSNAEYSILSKVFDQGIKNVLFGTGPSTFVFNYSKFRSPVLNQTVFWGTRFEQGNSTFLDWLLTKGVFSAFSLILLFVFVCLFGFKRLPKEKDSWMLLLGVFSGLLGLIVACFIYPFSFSLLFLFWLLLGIFLALTNPQLVKARKMTSSLKTSFVFIIVITLVLGFSLVFVQTQKYRAEAKYLKGVELFSQKEFNKAIDSLSAAVKLNPKIDTYWRDLGQACLNQADLASKSQELQGQDKRDVVQSFLGKGIDSLNRAIEIAPFNVANWNVRGFFYRNLIGVEGASELAIDSYKKAIECEPSSPFSYSELARVYLLTSQLDKAEENLNKALKLKADYAPAHYLLAVLYDKQGEIDKAINSLENAKKVSPQDIGLAFQLGVVYWRNNELDKAQKEFERAVNLNSKYSNAKYMLALIYNVNGRTSEAEKLFRETLELNPENKQLQKIIQNIDNGLPAMQGISVSSPPIQEEPSEIR